MTPSVRVQDEVGASAHAQRLSEAAHAALQDQGVERGQLTILLVDQPTIQRLNQQFAGLDRPTDVLSFPAGHVDPDAGEIDHGDVILCVPVASVQAAQAGHRLEQELTLLAIHGVLHLLGHDHARSEDKARMIDAQRRILRRLGSSLDPALE